MAKADVHPAINIHQIASPEDVSQLYSHSWLMNGTEGDSAFVFHYALGAAWSVFSTVEEIGLESAADQLHESDSGPNDPLQIFFLLHPCMNQDQGSPNSCNAVCGNTEKLFGEWTTLWSCLSLASLSLASKTFGRGNNSEAILSAIDTAMEGLMMRNITNFDGDLVLKHTLSCAKASCATDPSEFCDTQFEAKGKDFFEGKSGDLSFINGNFCNGVEGRVNIDLAGPGVSVFQPLYSSTTASFTLAECN
jgi:hypothetical protein